jgi:hypothetical protein
MPGGAEHRKSADSLPGGSCLQAPDDVSHPPKASRDGSRTSLGRRRPAKGNAPALPPRAGTSLCGPSHGTDGPYSADRKTASQPRQAVSVRLHLGQSQQPLHGCRRSPSEPGQLHAWRRHAHTLGACTQPSQRSRPNDHDPRACMPTHSDTSSGDHWHPHTLSAMRVGHVRLAGSDSLNADSYCEAIRHRAAWLRPLCLPNLAVPASTPPSAASPLPPPPPKRRPHTRQQLPAEWPTWPGIDKSSLRAAILQRG